MDRLLLTCLSSVCVMMVGLSMYTFTLSRHLDTLTDHVNYLVCRTDDSEECQKVVRTYDRSISLTFDVGEVVERQQRRSYGRRGKRSDGTRTRHGNKKSKGSRKNDEKRKRTDEMMSVVPVAHFHAERGEERTYTTSAKPPGTINWNLTSMKTKTNFQRRSRIVTFNIYCYKMLDKCHVASAR